MAYKQRELAKYDKVRKDVDGILPNSPIRSDQIHAELVLKWVLKLKPNADEALKIAALSHDIDRAITGIIKDSNLEVNSEAYVAFKRAHSIRSAYFICKILEKYDYPKRIIQKVRHLVENHESGGDRETNILTDADSIAYFEANIPGYLKTNGEDQTKRKIRFMYGRLSNRAKGIVKKIRYKNSKIASLVKESIH